jgi:outer membrane immunogenic protein
MKKIILATVLAGIGSTAALAADLGARTYTKAPAMMAPVSNWSGFYIGADAGYAFNGSSSGALTNSVGLGALPYDANLKGGLGGGFVGYNYQMQQFVIGVEADWQAASLRGTSGPGFVTSGGSVFGPFVETSKVKDYGSLRGRLGAAFDRLLVFGTAGWAGGSFSTKYTSNGVPLITNDHRATDGWSVGAGLEYAFTNNFLGRIEYRHTDLGKAAFLDASSNTGERGNNVRIDDIRLGLAYKF